LSHGSDFAVVVKQKGSGTCCALIERENVRQEASCFCGRLVPAKVPFLRTLRAQG
jgi:hypothetical protein